MAPVVIWILVALAVAGLVLVVASVTNERSGGVREFVADLRAGLRRGERREGVLAATRREIAEAEDLETSSVDDLFVVGGSDGGYVAAGDRAQSFAEAKDRAVRGVAQLTGR